ncbi:MAG: WXG100 family type VII secretion target [Ruminococcus sp.]|jgi:WXG100 family type VII secretion target
MATAWTIEMDYARAVSQAKQLESLSGELEKTAIQLENAMEQLKSGWQGEGADVYRGKGNQLAEKITKNARQLENTAQAIRNIAREVREAELENLRIAEERTY